MFELGNCSAGIIWVAVLGSGNHSINSSSTNKVNEISFLQIQKGDTRRELLYRLRAYN